jgi:general secretion pathway protein M
MKEWWSQLALREKQAVLLGGTFVFIFILYQFIWSPLLGHLTEMRHSIEAQQKTLIWMRKADKEIQSLQKNNKVANKDASPVALLSSLQKQINQLGLGQSLAGLKQASTDTIEMHFQKVEFDQLVLLLKQVSIVQLSAVAGSTPGMVDADLVVR